MTKTNTRYLAIGALVYAFVSGLWVLIAYTVARVDGGLLLVTAVPLLLLLGGTAVIIFNRSRNQPNQSSSAELGKWFGIIFAAEGIGIGVGSGILAGFDLAEWIVPLVAVMVGLHFLPLSRLLNLGFDMVLGVAIIVLTVATVVMLPVTDWPRPITLGTAVLLWLAGWGRLWVAWQATRSLLEKEFLAADSHDKR